MFASPEKNVFELGLMPSQVVADIGTGSGHYALALSRVVGREGQVYAVDLRIEALAHLLNMAKGEGRKNIFTLQGDAEQLHGTHLKSGLCHCTLLSNILSQLRHASEAVKESKRVLRAGGTCTVIDWASKLPQAEVKELFANEGLKFVREFEAGDEHYGLIFKK